MYNSLRQRNLPFIKCFQNTEMRDLLTTFWNVYIFFKNVKIYIGTLRIDEEAKMEETT